jgi:glycosyltransferase involved in cell wall biosynthesis/ubiquinone/menaquinone biosynthesis C-methylase UbiE
MRVILVSDHFSTPEDPGILRTWQVTKYLAEMGDDVTVIAPAQHYLFPNRSSRSVGKSILSQRVRLISMRTSPLRRGSILSRLRYYGEQCVLSAFYTWKAGRCDVVVAGLTPSMLGIGAFVAACLRRIPFVLDERDLALDAADQGGLVPRQVLWLARRIEHFLHHNAARVLTVTPGLRSLLLQRGLRPEIVVLAPNGCDILADQKLGDRRQLRRRMGWGTRTVVLYAGGLGHMYDLDVVLDALSLLDRDRFLIAIMGEGERKDHYIQRSKSENLPVIFPAPVSKTDVASVCLAADICVVPLRRLPWARLSLSNKLFDYLGAGRPVVVTGPGDMADLVHQAGAGLVVPPEDPQSFANALKALDSDAEVAERMGAAGREHVLKHWMRATSLQTFRRALVEAAGSGTQTLAYDTAEHKRIRTVYQYYDSSQSEQRKRDSRNPGVSRSATTRWSALRKVLLQHGLNAGASVLDVGCGSGGDLLRIADEFASLHPSLHGVDLLPDRIERARQALPDAKLHVCPAERLPYESQHFDIVICSTVFSSILDQDIARAIAAEMLRVVAEDGIIICYDVRYPNPFNPHTRAISRRRLRQLFPGARLHLMSVTLLPPLARRLGPFCGVGYGPLHAIPLLRSHYLAEVRPARHVDTDTQAAPRRDYVGAAPMDLGRS